MKTTRKIIAAILAVGILLSGVSANDVILLNNAPAVNTPDKSIGITILDDTENLMHESAQRIVTELPDYKSDAAQKLDGFTVKQGETVYLRFDMIDGGGTGNETCDITLTETLVADGKKIEAVAATVENLGIKSTIQISGLQTDKGYYFSVQSKTKSGNASFLFWKNEEAKIYFTLQPNETELNDVTWSAAPDWPEYSKMLKEYKIFEGDENGDLKEYSGFTRAEAAKAICASLSLNPYNSPEQMFSDVDSSHWAYGYINVLADLKIINGTENNLFEPERDVSYNEIVKMLVSALGYEPMAKGRSGYPNGYITVAESIGLTKDLEHYLLGSCPRHIAFILFYNALDIPMMFQTTWSDNGAEFAVADGNEGRDYITMRYKITGNKN